MQWKGKQVEDIRSAAEKQFFEFPFPTFPIRASLQSLNDSGVTVPTQKRRNKMYNKLRQNIHAHL